MRQFELASRKYTDRTWSYRVDDLPNIVIGDFTAVDTDRFVLLERDGTQGEQAKQKKVYLVDLRRVGADGYLETGHGAVADRE